MIKIMVKDVELSVSEARKLYNDLKILFGESLSIPPIGESPSLPAIFRDGIPPVSCAFGEIDSDTIISELRRVSETQEL